jgi:chromosome segregation ATPase
MENNMSLTKIGAYAGSVSAILALLWFIGEPALEKYVDGHIESYEKRVAEEESHKVKLRHLLGDKMEIADDEVHIELGRMYKNEDKLKTRVDSLEARCKYLENEMNLNLQSIQFNYDDIKKLQQQQQNLREELSHHGLFR